MRPMSVREMDALCYERGIELDPADVPLELAELAQGMVAQPAWAGRSLAQELYERRAAERAGAAEGARMVLGAGPDRRAWEREALERV